MISDSTKSNSQLLPIILKTASASPTYTINNGFTEKGKQKSRLNLTDDDNDRLSIAASKKSKHPIRRIDQKINYIRLEENSNIYVNIKSLTKRLLLSKETIKKASCENQLIDLIELQSFQQNLIIKSYEKILENLNSDEIKDPLDIDKNTLMKVIRTSIPILFNSKQQSNELSLSISDRHLYMMRRIDDRFELAIRTLKTLGQGNFGIIWKSLCLTSETAFNEDGSPSAPKELALKVAKDFKEAKKDLIKEYEMLKYLHKLNPHPDIPLRGIQAAPYQFVSLKAEHDEKDILYGYLGEKYDGNLNDCWNLPLEIKLKQGEDLLAGLAFLAKNKIIHGDIKPKNIFYKYESDGSITTHLSDFGSVIKMSSPRKNLWGVHTKSYVSKKLFNKALAYNDVKFFNYFNSLILQNDIFSAGIVLYKLFSGGRYPCKKDTLGYALEPEKFDRNHLKNLKVPSQLIDLIKEMLKIKPRSLQKIYVPIHKTKKYGKKGITTKKNQTHLSKYSINKSLTMKQVFKRFQNIMAKLNN